MIIGEMATRASFASWLENQMRAQGISQAELARRAGVTRAAINVVLNEKSGPGVELCQGIAKALGLPVDEVYRRAGLLPPVPDRSEIIDRITHELDGLPPEEQENIHEYVKLRWRLWKKKKGSK